MDFFNSLSPLLKTFWFVAIPASVIFAIQTVMTFVGGDSTDGTGADFHGDVDGGGMPFQLFSLRNLINFLLGFAWCGISFYDTIKNQTILIFVSLLVGIGFVYIFFLIINQVRKLAENNSFKISDTINKTAEVYLSIPGNNSGSGKVLISINGSVHELGAITHKDKIETGAFVKVLSTENDSLLIVEKI